MTTFEVRTLLAQHGIRPNKLLGQNFLVDDNVLKKIIEAADVKPNETILEIGPGLGELTWELAARAKKVIAVEKDKKLHEILASEIAKRGVKNIELTPGDILKLDMGIFARISPYRVIANIPYYLTARLIRKLLEEATQPTNVLLTVQKEVAERIAAQPPKVNLLALAVQVYGEPKILFPIPGKSFWPEPEVDSALIQIRNISKAKFLAAGVDEAVFFRVVRAAFQTKRKFLMNSMAKNLKAEKAMLSDLFQKQGFSPNTRPEELGMERWLLLIHALQETVPKTVLH